MSGTKGFYVLILVCIFCPCDCKIYQNVTIGFEAQGTFTLGNGGNQYLEWTDCHSMDDRIRITNATLTSNGIIQLDLAITLKTDFDDTVKITDEVLYTNSSLSPGEWRVISCNGYAGASCTSPDICSALANAPCPSVMNGTCECPIAQGQYTMSSRYKFETGIYYVHSTVHKGERMKACLDLMFHNNYKI